LLYFIEERSAGWISSQIVSVYHFSFGIIAFLVILVVKYSRRTRGFKATPMDFLVIFIAVVVPNLPDHSIKSFQLGRLAVEIVVLLFSYEVLLKELRGKFDALAAFTLPALIVLVVRGFLP
jgi:UDP-GlcNAc:undecaprenyl-phosphate GlcNAc-1-phosphate transferase